MMRNQQRYCLHYFTGGACVMCHYNPWKEKKHDRANGSIRQRNPLYAERKKALQTADAISNANPTRAALGSKGAIMNSETPRTDALLRLERLDDNMERGDLVCFARQLERELAAVTSERDRMQEALLAVRGSAPCDYVEIAETAP